MKASRHPFNALSAAKASSIKQPGRYADGNGLYLVVEPSGAKRWLLRTVAQGRRRDLGLGSFQLVSLAEARKRAVELRGIARAGGDPLAEKRKRQEHVPTFEEASRKVHEGHAPAWKNAKHANQWITTLQDYAFPLIGARRVDQIETPDVLRVLLPIWLSKPETARRVRQRLSAVFDWAKASGFRSSDNPVSGVSKALPRQPEKAVHHAALPYVELPDFVAALRSSKLTDSGRLAFEFLILTAARTGEVLGAQWSEFDLENKVWTVPANRMKAGREHRVPLAARTLEILAETKTQSASSTVVFSTPSGKPLSSMVFLMALRRMKLRVTAHGFRSAFRDWSAEKTNFSREVCEMALAHTVADKTEAAYRRGDLFEKRRQLMAKWSDYLTQKSAKVLQLRTA